MMIMATMMVIMTMIRNDYNYDSEYNKIIIAFIRVILPRVIVVFTIQIPKPPRRQERKE